MIDIVVIGAGLTGASAAYHLSLAGLRSIVLEAGPVPGWGASGRNAGHFQLIPENCLGECEGLLKERYDFMRRIYNSCHCQKCRFRIWRLAITQVNSILQLTQHNRVRMLEIIAQEQINCDLQGSGSVYLANNRAEEMGSQTDVRIVNKYGLLAEMWEPNRILKELGPSFVTGHAARHVPGDGNYHPVKFLTGMLQAALKRGSKLLTNTRVQKMFRLADGRILVRHADGDIVARKVIVATNAFTGALLPTLKSSIQPTLCQVLVTLRVPPKTHGFTITSDIGPTSFHQIPTADGLTALILSGGEDRSIKESEAVASPPLDTDVHNLLIKLRDRFFPEVTGYPVAQEWAGTMAFTKDQLPAIGELEPGLILAVGMNGYGGSYCCSAGQIAATLANGNSHPSWFNHSIFDPRRLFVSNWRF